MRIIAIGLFLLICNINFAQELHAKVTINTEQLETLGRDNLENFNKLIEDYLNSNKFTGDDWEGEPISCNFSIFFVSAGDNTYSAQTVITSQRPIYKSDSQSLMLKISDNNMSFKYEKNQSLYFDPTRFDALLSFLDYYAYMIIGMDMDSYQPLGGTEFFNKAYDISILGSNSSFSKGWAIETSSYNKRGLVEELLRTDFQQFRIDFYDYHYNGIDIFRENKKESYKNIVKLVNHLNDIYDKVSRMNTLMRVFFDTKNKEIFSYLKDYSDKDIFKTLKRIDPSHISTYEQGLND